MNWKIYYDDGTTFSSVDGSPIDAPALGVILLWQLTPHDIHHTAEKYQGLDWYWWRPDLDAWLSGDIYGYLDQSMHCGACYPKQGRVLTNINYQNILAIANKDPDFWDDPTK